MTNPDIPEPVQITIRHTHTDGTTLTGSTKGDGVYDIVRQPENGGFRWGRGVGIYLRGSRDGDAQVYKINAAVGALRRGRRPGPCRRLHRPRLVLGALQRHPERTGRPRREVHRAPLPR